MKHVSNFLEFFKESVVSKINEELIPSNNLRGDLIKLVGDGDVNALDKYMDANDVDVNYDSGMLTRLAAKQGKLDLIKYFDEIGADFYIRRNLVLKTALAYGKLDVAKYLLDELELDKDQIADIEEYVVSSESVDVREKRGATELLNQYK